MHDPDEIEIGQNVLEANRKSAERNKETFNQYGIFAVNLMGPPGCGKTTLLERTLPKLPGVKVAVIEGDLEGDADKVRVLDAGASEAYQINTSGACHLIAHQVEHALEHLNLKNAELVFIENVGNLVCPAEFDLGETSKVMVIGITEGVEKPLKYPLMFHKSDAVVVNKMDLLEFSGSDINKFRDNIKKINPRIEIFEVSCRTGEGIDAWVKWLKARLGKSQGL
jgi:hydrogenase nickel incorporation protein HypB